jgi:hypothetical protein
MQWVLLFAVNVVDGDIDDVFIIKQGPGGCQHDMQAGI